MNRNVVALVAGLGVLAPVGIALAQDAAVVEGKGYPVGEGTVIHPTLGAELGFTDNVFYQNTAELPLDRSSLVIRFLGANYAQNLRWWKGAWLQAVSPMIDLQDRIKAGGRPSYPEMIQAMPDPKTLAP